MSHVHSTAQFINCPQNLCIPHLLKAQAERTPDAIAIGAPGRIPLTYGRLWMHIDDVVKTLHEMGVGRNDRAGLVLPDGPEMAVAFLAVATGATCAPLNPAYSTREFDFYLSDLHVRVLIMQAGLSSPARAVAQARGIPILELSTVFEAEAGLFTLTGKGRASRAALCGFAQPNDVALVLHTSGTTSRPKIVPLTHINLCTSASDHRITLELIESDRGLNVMPLFHAHGLITAVLSSLLAGASVFCAPGFDALKFFEWMEEFRPTWYTASPTIQRAVLTHATSNLGIIECCPLRFIRSSGASLVPQVLAQLERVFKAPVLEAYGLTETSGAIVSNPLPPLERKVGSVGVALGAEVAIMDEAGNLLPTGEVGEVVIRGATVIQGYENNSTANASAFINGWFRTGDQGFLDVNRYLFITGRLKEIINRGGEKISPFEVEEVLMQHPAVAQVAAFAVPHAQLGEDIAAAIVLHENVLAAEREIREFAVARLAAFKVPHRLVFVDEIPKGATGKVQRIGLAEKLDLTVVGRAQPESEGAFVAPRTPLESLIVEIWQDVLGVDHVGVYDNFIDLGGYSLLSMQVIATVEKKLGLRIHPTELMFQTLGQLASACEARMCPPQSLESMHLLPRLLHALKGVISRSNK